LKYYCQFPGCNYCTDIRSQINYHHIKPIEIDGKDDIFNRIYLCPNHHTKIYIPESKNGQHTFKSIDSIILLKKYKSTSGTVVEYIDSNGNNNFFVENLNSNSSL
jgi:hypothetical protein